MDDVPLCPPYWPLLLWWLIHRPHPPGPGDPPPIDWRLVSRLDAHFAAISVLGLAAHLGDKRVSEEIGKLAAPLAAMPIADLGHLTRGT